MPRLDSDSRFVSLPCSAPRTRRSRRSATGLYSSLLLVASSSMVVASLGCGGRESANQPRGPASACLAEGNTVDEGGAAVRPAACESSCLSDDDCIVVNASCPGCCDPVAINSAYEGSYLAEKNRECEKYTGLVCGCDQAPPTPRCVSHMCTAEY